MYSASKPNRAWGTFTTDTDLHDISGPDYHEEMPANPLSASKVSTVGGGPQWDALLLAKLRFKPDVLEPTSL